MSDGPLRIRLCGPFCPPGSAHYRYWQQSLAGNSFTGKPKPFKPSAELLRQMDEEQAAYDAGEKDWVRREEIGV